MNIFVPKETEERETRVVITPAHAKSLVELGAEVVVEAGAAAGLGHADADFSAAGARLATDRGSALHAADLVFKLRKPSVEDVRQMKPGTISISQLDPFNNRELILELAKAGVSAISLEMLPRTTLAQKMDVLSSQASLAGYEAVLVAATHLKRIFPMMMTPSGTLTPSRVFVIGVGVAGLQAIATARRLGARVTAFDTRPAVAEQITSLGAQIARIELGETGQTQDGYAKPLTEEQLSKQREGMARYCAESDVVITTAQVFGRKAPVLVTTEMVKAMKPCSVVVDMAMESGGNVECSVAGAVVEVQGVQVIGYINLARRACVHASQMLSNNLFNLIEHFWDKTAKAFVLRREDEIMKGCLITHNGEIVNERIRELN